MHDVVIFGATGFTGRLTAEYMARHAPVDCRWALAGRNPAKLRAVRAELVEINPVCAELPLLHADVGEPSSLRDVAERARVVATTVGPFLHHGDPLVAACADAGTDYVDITGEPEFVDLMYARHHERAARNGARIVHACGFDSVPHDLGVLFTVGRLPVTGPVRVDGFVRAGARFSGGTYTSALTALSRPLSMRRAARARRSVEQPVTGRRARARVDRPHRSRQAGAWALPLPTLDPQVVVRSARALERYGSDFTYGHHAAVRRLPVALAAVVGMGVLAGLAQIPPVRARLSRLLQPGSGPSAEQRARGWFTVRFVGRAGDSRVVTEVSGGDPGYDETSKMLAESALCLACDELPASSGQVTTATAMGDALIERLVRAGMRFEVLHTAPTGPPRDRAGREAPYAPGAPE